MDTFNLTFLEIASGEDKSSPFKNCLRNHYKHIRKWAKRTATNCFRIYDRQVPGYPLAIDYYDRRFCIHYFASKVSEDPPSDLIEDVAKTLSSLFGIDPSFIYWRTRMKRKETRQYEKRDATLEFFTVLEYGIKFKINLSDYLDTGLFLDHRETRKMVASISKDKRVLNLFAYTCAFSVHAAAAGARFTKSVDMSNTYVTWGQDNFTLNSLPFKNNEICRADCLKFLDEEVYNNFKYDVIIIDPPTISRSKKMDQLFDIQFDYIPLISKSLRLLNSGGKIFFSTNSRKFEFDATQFPASSIVEITEKTIPIDFIGSKIHRCWEITVG